MKAPQIPLLVALVAFDGVQVLDVTGPASVFSTANEVFGNDVYGVKVVSSFGGILRTSNSVDIATRPMAEFAPECVHTLLIGGGEEDSLRNLITDQPFAQWIRSTAKHAQRFGSVCTGAFVLAQLGLAGGKRVATHWASCTLLGKHFPDVKVDANALFVEDGRMWTSGGVTTGIDMCLAMVERDFGSAVANAVAKRLVLYLRRPGHQSQFSPVLHAQTHAGAAFGELVQWMTVNLSQPLDVGQLAERCSMSERTFYRKFTETIGETPARFVETLRLDLARQLLNSGAPLKRISSETGFASNAKLSSAFVRRFGITPALFREMHRTAVLL